MMNPFKLYSEACGACAPDEINQGGHSPPSSYTPPDEKSFHKGADTKTSLSLAIIRYSAPLLIGCYAPGQNFFLALSKSHFTELELHISSLKKKLIFLLLNFSLI